MHWRTPIQGWINGICRRIVKLLLTIVSWKSRTALTWFFYGLWIVRVVTKWTRVCDRRSARLTYIHHTCEFKLYCDVGNAVQCCRFGLFQDSDFAGDLEDSNSRSSGLLCSFGSYTFVPTSWMCKKQTSFSLNSTEDEITSLDACLRVDGIPALDLWDLVVEVFHFSPNHLNNTKIKYEETRRVTPHQTSTPKTKP